MLEKQLISLDETQTMIVNFNTFVGTPSGALIGLIKRVTFGIPCAPEGAPTLHYRLLAIGKTQLNRAYVIIFF